MTRALKLILCLIVVFFSIKFSNGQQSDTVRINSLKPFDREFPFRYDKPSKNVKYTNASLFEVDKKGCLKNFTNKKLRTCKQYNKLSPVKKTLLDLNKKELDSLKIKLKSLVDTSLIVIPSDKTKHDTLNAETIAKIKMLLSLKDSNKLFRTSLYSLNINSNDSGILAKWRDSLNSSLSDTLKAQIIKAKKNFKNYLENIVESTELPFVDSVNAPFLTVSFPQLRPNRSYFLVLSSQDKIEGIDSVIELLQMNDSVKASTLYKSIQERNSVKIQTKFNNQCSSCNSIGFEIGGFDQFKEYYSGYLKTIAQNLFNKRNELRLNERVAKDILCIPTDFKIDDVLFRSIIKRSQECIGCRDTVLEYKWLNERQKNIYSSLYNLAFMGDTLVAYGYMHIDSLNKLMPVKKMDYEKRVSNLYNTIFSVDSLIRLLDYLHLKYSFIGYNNFRQNLLAGVDELKTNYDILKGLADIQKKVKKDEDSRDSIAFRFDGFTLPKSNIPTNTFTYDFQTRAGFALRPDFGFMYYYNPFIDPGFSGFAPYLGFHINFRPLNINTIFSHIDNLTFWERLSFNSGALIGSFAQSGQRDGLVGNTAIFTGLGYAFGHGVRFTMGSVWYRKLDENPTISNETVAAIPYAGISIDVILKDISNSFTNLFK